MSRSKSKYAFCSLFIAFLCLYVAVNLSVLSAEEKKDLETEKKTASIEISKPLVDPKSVDENSPTGLIINYEKEVKGIVKKYKDKDTKEAEHAKNSELIEKVRGFFDLKKLAKIALGKHWVKRSPKERNEYTNLFQKLIENSYISKSDGMLGNYEIKYKDEEIEGKEAIVKSTVIKEDADVDVEYEMHKNNSGWMIYNVIADETNLASTYRSSFNSIIGKYGFPGLMKRMRNKLRDSKNGG